MAEVAAYASLLSLLHVLDQIQHPARSRLLRNTNQIQTLHEKVRVLQEFLEIRSGTNNKEIEDLARQVAEVAYEAELMIDSHILRQMRDGFEKRNSSSFCQDIDKVTEKINSLLKKKFLTNDGKQQPNNNISVSATTSTLPSSGGKNTMVGFDDHLVQIMDQLTAYQPNLQIIPIVGMGGIGKTTLARNAFENKCVAEHFEVRVWFTISQNYNVHGILLGILRDIGVTVLEGENFSRLQEKLYKHLFGKRYLIVVDDVWSTKAWNDLKFSFPNNGNGSRVMVTTRLSDVAVCLGSRSPYFMNLLDEDKSWNLFCEITFAQQNCSPELEEPGKKVAKSCRGLPLAIVVIGGFLAKSNMTREYWEFVAENVNLYANSENDEQCLKILALSYHHLPIHLKPCFLYMRVFPKDHEVQVSGLIKLWIAEGFLKPSRDKNLEEVAKEYLKDLIDRNLILIGKQGRIGKIKTCGIHDLLRDLCMRESHKKHVFSVPKVQRVHYEKFQNNMCFLCCDAYTEEKTRLRGVILGSRSWSFANPQVCDACRTMYPELTRLKFVKGMLEEFPLSTTLRHLTVKARIQMGPISFSSITLLWNLQTLIIHSSRPKPIVLPYEIWEMPQIRHIQIRRAIVPDHADNQIEREDCTILENLHTLSNVENFRLTNEVVKRIRNMKKLRITYLNNSTDDDRSYYFLHNLVHLSKLESLFLTAQSISSDIISFPYSLKKLVLGGCRMRWEDMTIIGSLPDLEVLKLKSVAFEGPEWSPVEGEFLQLKCLSIHQIYLVFWRAENIHFPCLESLVLEEMHDLYEIPSDIGEIDTLHSIDLIMCSETLTSSAKQILENASSMGNDGLEVYVTDRNGRRRREIASSDSLGIFQSKDLVSFFFLLYAKSLG